MTCGLSGERALAEAADLRKNWVPGSPGPTLWIQNGTVALSPRYCVDPVRMHGMGLWTLMFSRG